ncbi:DUF72 domain-containing protein [Anatilimnocola sp. NA78]|uniref:DUF72 domain-containing protein n=1 Tax=Anatilimnocola sp. NA78 TaxID=3415683 RepID=UPI003CE5946D
MQFFIGTSGYSYKEWKGSFYPEKISPKKMLPFYGEHFNTTEINYTFRTMPTEAILQSWAEQVPESFRFALKAPQAITHFKRLKNTGEATELLFHNAAVLKDRLGPILFQLPDTLKKDVGLLDAFLKSLGEHGKVAFEFRHASWFDEEVYDCLRNHSVALCSADTAEVPLTGLVSTADWGYVRLRGVDYSAADIRQWHERIQSQKWQEAYVFFKHEDTGSGPKLAKQLLELMNHK